MRADSLVVIYWVTTITSFTDTVGGRAYTTFHWIHSYDVQYRRYPLIWSCSWWRPWTSMVQMAPEEWQASLAHVPLHFINNQSFVHLEGSDLSVVFISNICMWALCTCNGRFASVGERFQWRRFFFFRYIPCLAAFNEVLSFWHWRDVNKAVPVQWYSCFIAPIHYQYKHVRLIAKYELNRCTCCRNLLSAYSWSKLCRHRHVLVLLQWCRFDSQVQCCCQCHVCR